MPAMSEGSRFKLAVAISPLVPALIVVLGPALLLPGSSYGNALPLLLFFSIGTSYLGLFVIGLPVILLLRRLALLNLGTLALVGAVGGIVAFAAFSAVLTRLLQSSGSFGPPSVAWGAGLGLAVALSFGAIAGITSRSRATSPPSAAPRLS
jgi:hypothetical protein